MLRKEASRWSITRDRYFITKGFINPEDTPNLKHICPSLSSVKIYEANFWSTMAIQEAPKFTSSNAHNLQLYTEQVPPKEIRKLAERFLRIVSERKTYVEGVGKAETHSCH